MTLTTPRAGDVLGHFRLLEQVGAGGMGVVFRARDEKLDRDVALKVIAPGLLSEPEVRRRFRNEALALSRLNHPNIQTVHAFDTQDGVDYLVGEFVEGTSLDQRVAKGPLPAGELVAVGRQLLAALAAAHAAGVIHRDLKPGNLRVRPDGQLKVLDFGLAKQLATADTATAESLSTPGVVAGTLPYMAPEVLRGGPADQRSDVYSAGAVLYELATGRRPHPESGSLLVEAILNRHPVAPAALNPELPPALDHAIQKALDKNPEYRWPAALDVQRELDRIAASAGIGAGMQGEQRPQRRRRAMALAFASLAIAAVAFSSRFWGTSPVPAGAHRIQSLAVLPLQNVSGDSDQDYFADALTEELTNEMAALHSLQVISRTSAKIAAQRPRPLREISEELKVDGLIEGSVLRDGDRTRVTVQLIDARRDRHVWSRSYERQGSDIIALQRVIAQAVAQEIQLALTPAEEQRLSRPMTANAQAYESYLRATYRLSTVFSSAGDVDVALRYAEAATSLDPNFAEAHVALARACAVKIFGWGGGAEYDEKAFVALGKALAINPSMADAYTVRGNLRFTRLHGFDIPGAVSDYRRAINLNPNLVEAHHGLGSELTHAGLHDAALEEFRATLRLDPHHTGAAMRLGRVLWQSNRFADAVAHYERIGLNHVERALALAYAGRRQDAWAVLRNVQDPSHRAGRSATEDVAALTALLHALDGDQPAAEREVERSIEAGASRDHFHHAAFVIAAAHAEMGQTAPAVRWLRFAAENGMPNYPLFRDAPSMQRLRESSEYDRFVSELGTRWRDLRERLTVSQGAEGN